MSNESSEESSPKRIRLGTSSSSSLDFDEECLSVSQDLSDSASGISIRSLSNSNASGDVLISETTTNDDTNKEQYEDLTSPSSGSSILSPTMEDELVFMNDKYKDTELHAAIKANNLPLIQQILSSGVDVNAPGENGYTPLYVAVQKGFLPGVKYLVEYGANISGKFESEDWETPLHLAVKNQRLDILELLLTTEINVKKLKKNYEEHLYHAIEGKNFKLINCLAGVSIADYNKSMQETFKNFSMHELSKIGYGDDLKTLLFGKNMEINARNKIDETLLLLAVKNNDLKMIEYLLQNGADVNADNCGIYSPGWTALHAAADLGLVDAVDLLLTNEKCDVNVRTSDNGTPLHLAASKHIEIVKKLVEKNAQLYIYGKYRFIAGLTPYHVAVCADKMDIVKYFLDKVKIDVDIKTLYGESALQIAARAENFRMVSLLINHGANVNHFSRMKGSGFTALHAAVQKGNFKMVEFLIERGADVNVAGGLNKTVLHMAVCVENENIIKFLLSHRADVNSRSSSYRFEEITPLLEATSRNLKDVILMLINAGADLNATTVNKFNKMPQSIIDVAIRGYGDGELLKMLLNLGADINDADINVNEDLPVTIWDILKEHVHKLKAANLFVSKKNLEWAKLNSDEWKNLKKGCSAEVDRMKKKKIGDSNVYFYDLLVKDLDQVVKYAENRSIRKNVKLEEIKYLFPLYADMLVCCFKKGLKRNQLLNNVERALQNIFAGLPHNCVRTILLYLNNDDLMICLGEKVILEK